MKYFVVTDVHSCYDELITTLNEAGFDMENEEHHFVSCGDLLDRGMKPLETLRFVNSIPKDRKHLVYGNHEWLMEDMIKRNYTKMYDYHNGTAWTVAYSFKDPNVENYIQKFSELPEWKEYISQTKDYVELGDFIFVHGWIPCYEQYDNYDKFEDDWRNHSFEHCRWYNGMNAWLDGVKEIGKTIVCGHVKSEYGLRHIHNITEPYDFSKPFIDDGIIALDSNVFRTKKLNCIIIEL